MSTGAGASTGSERSALRPGPRNSLADVEGIVVGHHHRIDADAELGAGWATGCTAVLAPDGATGGVDVRGGGPGTRETDLLDPANSVQRVDAVLLTGGSAYGLGAADGLMRWLEDNGRGIAMGGPDAVVPIVPAAVIFDLPVGGWRQRPDTEFGHAAAASAGKEFAQGSVGAGAGARAGALKGGVGSASVVLPGGVTVGAIVVANPVGAVFDPMTGLPYGVDAELDGEFSLVRPVEADLRRAADLAAKATVLNTTIGVVATDAPLSKAGCRRMATAAHDGLARAIRPAHSPLDGDTFFALATGRVAPKTAGPAVPEAFPPDLALLGAVCAAAADCVQRAIVHAVLAAAPVAGIPSYRDVFRSAFRG